MDSALGSNSAYSLNRLYDQVELQYQKLEGGEWSNSNVKFQETVTDALKSLSTLQKAISMLSLFSENEHIDEVNPNYLKFFLVDFYIGRFISLINARHYRLQNLERAKEHYHNFLMLCDRYSVATPESLKALKADNPVKMITSRDERIERHRRFKDLGVKLKDLKERQKALANSELASDDTDLTKEIYLTVINLHQQKAVDELMSIHQESELLRTMPEETQPDDTPPEVDSLTWRLDSLPRFEQGKAGCLDPQGRPLQPFVITGKQMELRDQVFRPGWRLPTMSIEEYLQMEMERGNFLKGGGERPRKVEADYDNDEAAQDAATLKQREWDEFKDSNPRGSGNRANKG